MITPSDRKPKPRLTQSSPSISIVLGALISWIVAGTACAQNNGLPIASPELRRMLVLESKCYTLDFTDSLGNYGRSFIVADSPLTESPQLVRVYLFGKNMPGGHAQSWEGPPNTLYGYRWSLGVRTVFVTWDPDLYPEGGPANVLKYPMALVVVGPDGTAMFDSKKLPGPVLWGGGKEIPMIGLSPIHAHRLRWCKWKEGAKLPEAAQGMCSELPKEIHYDIRALDDDRLELYMTADGKLQRWLYDGENWTLEKDYSVEIHGPFLVCDEGNGAVAEREGQWCLIEPLEADAPEVRPIVAKVQDESLLLIEDRVAGTVYFEQEGKLYDERGTRVWSMPSFTDTPAKVRAISNFVRSRHAP